MDRFGTYWKRLGHQSTPLHTQMRQDQLEHQVIIEQQAAEFFDRLKENIPAYIDDAIARKSLTVGVPVHASLLNSAAFTYFRVWLSEQSLGCICGSYSDPTPAANMTLSLTPLD